MAPIRYDDAAAMPSRKRSASVTPPEVIRALEGNLVGESSEEKLSPCSTWEDVRYEYLTFDTELPHLVPVTLADGSICEPPDLKKFDSPFRWSTSRKIAVLIISCCVSTLASYSSGAYSMAFETLPQKWHLSNTVFDTGVTCWSMGSACSPMFLAPFSEIHGRRPVLIGSAFLSFVGLIACALTDSFAGMLVARFFVGMGASTCTAMVGGIVSDIYHARDRNTPMAICSCSALAGIGLGPLVSGFIIDRVLWRWVFWVQVMALGTAICILVLFFNETRGSLLLGKKAKALNAYFDKLDKEKSPKIRYKCAADESRASIQRTLYTPLSTTCRLLFTEPVVFFFSLWISFALGVTYMTFEAIPLVFRTSHNFTVSQIGAVFSAITIGSIIGTILSIYQEKIARRYWTNLTPEPERRLYFACLESALLPIGLFWFGWTSSSSMHWILPVLALGCAQIGIFSIYLAVFNYLADVYHRYASSALAGQSLFRNLLSAIFPLFTTVMFQRLGYPGASALLGGVGSVLTVVPWVLIFFGPAIRGRSRIAREIMGHESKEPGLRTSTNTDTPFVFKRSQSDGSAEC